MTILGSAHSFFGLNIFGRHYESDKNEGNGMPQPWQVSHEKFAILRQCSTETQLLPDIEYSIWYSDLWAFVDAVAESKGRLCYLYSRRDEEKFTVT
jgi:hypothetical protein